MLLFTLVLSAFLALTTAQASDDSSCYSADIGFVMDVSNSVGKTTNLDREKSIVKKLVGLFDVKLGGSRAGLIAFNNKATTLVEIGQKSSAAEFNKVVDSINQTGGLTLIDRALMEATNVLFGTKYQQVHANKYLVILTTGKQDPPGSNIDLKILTRSLRHLRVRIVAVGLPPSEIKNLRQLVAVNEHVVTIVRGSQPDNIDNKIKEIKDVLCSKPPAYVRKCLKKIDLGFALDASGSIGNRTFHKVRAFVTDLLKQLSLSMMETHAGVIVYSTEPKLVIKLNEFYNLALFSKALSSRTHWKRPGSGLRWMNGYTRIDLALTLAKNELFTQANGDRPNVRNALIFLTDGEQKPPAPLPLNLYARPLINDNVTIFAVGFGRAKLNELQKISSSPEFVLSYNGSVEVLQKAVEEIVHKLCNYCTVNVNLGFLIDASRTTSVAFDGLKTLVKHVAEGFALKPGGSKAAVITFSDHAVANIPFTSDLDFFKIEVDYLKSHGGQTFIDRGLLEAGKVFSKHAKVGLPNILIVLTDGQQTGHTGFSVKLAADSLRKKNITIFAVSTRFNVDDKYENILREIAGGDDNFLRWNTDILGTLVPEIVKKACRKPILGTKRDEIGCTTTGVVQKPFFEVNKMSK